MGGGTPCTEDPRPAPGPEVPWDTGSRSRDSTTLDLGFDVPMSVTPDSLAPLARARSLWEDDHTIDKPMSPRGMMTV
jgi:hypothetical protein